MKWDLTLFASYGVPVLIGLPLGIFLGQAGRHRFWLLGGAVVIALPFGMIPYLLWVGRVPVAAIGLMSALATFALAIWVGGVIGALWAWRKRKLAA